MRIKLLELFSILAFPNVGSILLLAKIVYVPFWSRLTLFTTRVLEEDVTCPIHEVVAAGLLSTEQVKVNEEFSFTAILLGTAIGYSFPNCILQSLISGESKSKLRITYMYCNVKYLSYKNIKYGSFCIDDVCI